MATDMKIHLYKGLAAHSKYVQKEILHIFDARKRNGLSCNALTYSENVWREEDYCLMGHGWEVEFRVENKIVMVQLLISSGNNPILEAKEMRQAFVFLASQYRDFKFIACCNECSLKLVHKLRDRGLINLEEDAEYRGYTDIEFAFTELFFNRYGNAKPIEVELHEPEEMVSARFCKTLSFKPKKRT